MAAAATPDSVIAIVQTQSPNAIFTFVLTDSTGATVAAGTTVTATLSKAGAPTVSGGLAMATPIGTGGNTTVTVTPDRAAGPSLSLTLTPDGGTAVTVTIGTYFFNSYELVARPVQLQQDGSAINFVVDAGSENLTADVSVTFAADASDDKDALKLFFPTNNPIPQTVAGTGTSTVQIATAAVGQSFINQNKIYPPLQINASIAATDGNKAQTNPMSASAQAIITQLLPPKVYLPNNPQIITQDMFDGDTIPWQIPMVGNAAADDLIVLYATSQLTGATSMLGKAITVKDADRTKPHRVDTPSTASIYQSLSDQLNVYYDYVPADGDIDDPYPSLPDVVQIQRTEIDSTIDQTLRPPTPSQFIYTYTDEEQTTDIAVTVAFDGVYVPVKNDRITVHLDLTGYTIANQGQVKPLALDPYVLTATDADQKHALVVSFPNNNGNGFTANKLNGINGSNGSLYYTVESSPDGLTYGPPRTSPSMAMVIDTIPPYTGGKTMALTPLLDRLKRRLPRRR